MPPLSFNRRNPPMTGPHPTPALRDLFFSRSLEPTLNLLRTPGLELTYNARGALLRACNEVARTGKREILLPAFHCPSGITPAIRSGLTPVFYRIRRDLTIDYEDLLSKAGPTTGAVLVIHYFGIAVDLSPIAALRKNGVALIEDWSHSFIQGEPPRLAGSDSEYRVYSFWKLLPSGVGGGLVRGRSSKDEVPPSPAAPLLQQLVNFKQLFEQALDHSDYRLARTAFSLIERFRLALKPSPARLPESRPSLRGEDRYPFDHRLAVSRVPASARRIIESFDLRQVARERRRNFSLYGKLLSNTGPLQVLYPELPAEACPWVFPVLLRGRETTDHLWRDSGVALHTFGILLHSSLFETGDAQTIGDARFLADNVLCLAIHQGISENEIRVSAEVIRSNLAPCT